MRGVEALRGLPRDLHADLQREPLASLDRRGDQPRERETLDELHQEEGALVVLADVSAATDRSHLELGRSVVESLAAHLGPADRIAIVSADLTIRSVIDGETPGLGEATPERIEALLDGLARVPAGGATDLGEAIAEAAGLLDPERQGAVVYVGGSEHRVAAFDVVEVEPTGAGDVFATAFFVSYQASGDAIAAARFANCAASFVVQGAGTGAIPTMAQVRERMRASAESEEGAAFAGRE